MISVPYFQPLDWVRCYHVIKAGPVSEPWDQRWREADCLPRLCWGLLVTIWPAAWREAPFEMKPSRHTQSPRLVDEDIGTLLDPAMEAGMTLIFQGKSGKILLCLFHLSPRVPTGTLRPNELQHARLPCLSPTLWACSNLCPLSR